MNDFIENYIKGLPRGNITNESECSICRIEFDIENRTDRKLNCSDNCVNSVFHEDCIINWIQQNPANNSKCMFCNKNLNIRLSIYKQYSENYIKNGIVMSITSLIYDIIFLCYTKNKIIQGKLFFNIVLIAIDILYLSRNTYKLHKSINSNILYLNLPEALKVYVIFLHIVFYAIELNENLFKNNMYFCISNIIISILFLINSVIIMLKINNKINNLDLIQIADIN